MTEAAERPILTDRQKDVYEYIVNARLDGCSVGLRDVARAFNFGPSAASNHLKALVKKGYLIPGEGRMNSIRPTSNEFRVKPTDRPGVVELRTTGPVEINVADLQAAA
jgi:SOS-response transcriptional repressor LexA